jgi:hypothetical protein
VSLTLLLPPLLLSQLIITTSKKVAMSANKEGVFLSNKTFRRPGGGRPQKYPDLEDFIVKTVKQSWESGASISPEQLHHLVMKHALTNKDAYNKIAEGNSRSLNRYVQRVLERHKFSVRAISISQSVPRDWRSKAEENAARIRATFLKEKVDVVINADETFLLFHPFGQRLIAPTGIKRVGSVVQVDNEKWGATVMIACEYRTSCILPPMIIFTGVHCAKLMKQWSTFDQAKVIFNESHWMTANAAIIYVSYLMSMFKGKKIGLIWDKHTSHYCTEVLDFIAKSNVETTTSTKLVAEMVDEGLTPIIQVPDVAVNKVFKAGVKKRYHEYRSGLPVTIGKKITVSREKMVEFVLDTIEEINMSNNENQFIADAFKRCGLNPWSRAQSMEAFHQHLQKLESNEILRAMISNQNVLSLMH